MKSNYRKADKYTADSRETFATVTLAYETHAEIYNLDDAKKHSLAPSILDGNALRYYHFNMKGKVTSYDHFKQMNMDKFHDRSRQDMVIQLQSLMFDQFIKDGVTPSDALARRSLCRNSEQLHLDTSHLAVRG